MFLFSTLILLTSLVAYGSASQKAITHELSHHIQHLLDSTRTPGLTLGVVHPTGTTEIGAWGVRSEDGEVTTEDVREMSEQYHLVPTDL